MMATALLRDENAEHVHCLRFALTIAPIRSDRWPDRRLSSDQIDRLNLTVGDDDLPTNSALRRSR